MTALAPSRSGRFAEEQPSATHRSTERQVNRGDRCIGGLPLPQNSGDPHRVGCGPPSDPETVRVAYRRRFNSINRTAPAASDDIEPGSGSIPASDWAVQPSVQSEPAGNGSKAPR